MACVLVGYQTAPINERARKLTFSAGHVSAANSLLLNTSTGAFPDNYGSGMHLFP
jgi:hypothetical protein